MLKKIITILIILIIVYIVLINLFRKRCNDKIMFSHGFRDDKKNSNSIEYIENSIKKNFKGVEIDLYFISEINDFILTHDYKIGEIKVKKFTTLNQVFHKFRKNKIIFWLDLKNLNKENHIKCRDLLTHYKKIYNTDFILESPNYIYLLFISITSKIKTSFWIDKKKEILYLQTFDYISMDVENYCKNKLFFNILSPLPINLFTINCKDTIKQLREQNNIHYIITDNNN